MNKLQRIEEMEKQLAALRAEVEREEKPKQWDPKGGEWYYASNGAMTGVTNKKTRDYGIERQTKEQAEADYELARAYNRLLAYKAEFDADFVPDWDDEGQKKFCVYMDHRSQRFEYFYNDSHYTLTAVYFSEQAAKELCDKLNTGEVVL